MKNLKLPLTLAALAMLTAACGTTPQTDANFGEASLTLKAQQLHDPAAALRNEKRTVNGIEGQAASNAVDQYYKSFNKPAPTMSILNMGVFGGMD